MSPAPNRSHQNISLNLTVILYDALKNDHCKLYAAPFDVRLVKTRTNDDKLITVNQPDLCVVCDDAKPDDRGCNGAPDPVIEILFPGNSKKELSIKFDLYEENGVKEYWIAEPIGKTIFIYTSDNNKYRGLKSVTQDDVMKSPLFPHLNFSINDVFNR